MKRVGLWGGVAVALVVLAWLFWPRRASASVTASAAPGNKGIAGGIGVVGRVDEHQPFVAVTPPTVMAATATSTATQSSQPIEVALSGPTAAALTPYMPTPTPLSVGPMVLRPAPRLSPSLSVVGLPSVQLATVGPARF